MPTPQDTIEHFVFFPFPPSEVYTLLLDEDRHAAFTGAPAHIEPRVGGRFTVFDGKISGVTTELTANALIVQDWTGSDWGDAKPSTVRFALASTNEGRGCALSFRHEGLPPAKREELDEGWRRYYWQPMAEYLRNSKVVVVRRFLEKFKNQAKLDVVDKTWTQDCVLHIQGFDPPPGRAGQKEVGKLIFNAFTQVHVEVIDTIVEGDRVVERHRATAVHTGEFMGIAATNRTVYWTENHIYRMEGDMIAETWSEVSFHDVIRQISEPRDAANQAQEQT